jgi:MoxR-like ATPase
VPVQQLLDAQTAVQDIRIGPDAKEYIVSLVEATRHHEDIYLGASPRGSLALYNAARAWAALKGREFVIPDDIKALAEPTLAHRAIVTPAARMSGIDSRQAIATLLRTVPVPGAQPEPVGGATGWRSRREG